MAENWLVAYEAPNLHLAEIAKQLLDENHIQSVVLNKQDSNYLFGNIEVMVDRDNLIVAKNILKELIYGESDQT